VNCSGEFHSIERACSDNLSTDLQNLVIPTQRFSQAVMSVSVDVANISESITN
jgi:hypothetical protein